jgi:hypothetical protein
MTFAADLIESRRVSAARWLDAALRSCKLLAVMYWHEQELADGDASAGVMRIVSRDLDSRDVLLEKSRPGRGEGGLAQLIELNDPEQAHVGAGLQHFVLLEGCAVANVIVEQIFTPKANRHLRQYGSRLIKLEGVAHLPIQ